MNAAVEPELLWLLLDRSHDAVKALDQVGCMGFRSTDASSPGLTGMTHQYGRAPLHLLCANRAVTPTVIEIVYDAFPTAAVLADEVM